MRGPDVPQANLVERYRALQISRTSARVAAVLALCALAAAVWWWRVGRGPEVTVAVPTRGTAVEIVYATGAVEPVRWAKVASLIRDRIVDLCYCEGKTVAKGDVLARLDD
jgi:membrane fusion protein (multidrug efflux system)